MAKEVKNKMCTKYSFLNIIIVYINDNEFLIT